MSIPAVAPIDLTGAGGGDESGARRRPARASARTREERPMPIARMDHFTILTTNAEKTVAFYNDILGFTPGPRPAFSFPGAWLYNDGKAVLHVVQRPSIPEGGGVLDHIAFLGTDAVGLCRQAEGARDQIRPEAVASARPRGRACGNCSSSIRAARGSRSTLRRARRWRGRA